MLTQLIWILWSSCMHAFLNDCMNSKWHFLCYMHYMFMLKFPLLNHPTKGLLNKWYAWIFTRALSSLLIVVCQFFLKSYLFIWIHPFYYKKAFRSMPNYWRLSCDCMNSKWHFFMLHALHVYVKIPLIKSFYRKSTQQMICMDFHTRFIVSDYCGLSFFLKSYLFIWIHPFYYKKSI